MLARLLGMIIGVSALVGWACWIAILLAVPPTSGRAQLAFYAALFVASAATVTIFVAASRQRRVASQIGHGLIAALLLCFTLWLQSLRMLNGANLLLILVIGVFVELAFRLGERRPASP